MSNRDRGDDYYNDHGDEYDFADEVGWIKKSTGEIVERHNGFQTRRQREEQAEMDREAREDRRRGF